MACSAVGFSVGVSRLMVCRLVNHFLRENELLKPLVKQEIRISKQHEPSNIQLDWRGVLRLDPLTKRPCGIFYGQFKRDSFWHPLRKGLRFYKLLVELAPKTERKQRIHASVGICC
jgi:hypothetical protein